jgi:predicted DNA-binding transcriptional regulator AlpA
MLTESSPALIHGAAVSALCGGVHYQTLLRWRRDPELNFPKPITINGRLYWRESDIAAWVRSREEVSNAAA